MHYSFMQMEVKVPDSLFNWAGKAPDLKMTLVCTFLLNVFISDLHKGAENKLIKFLHGRDDQNISEQD